MSNKKFKASQRELARVRAISEPEIFRDVHRAPVHALAQSLVMTDAPIRQRATYVRTKHSRKVHNVCASRVVVVVSSGRRIEAASQVQERPDYSWCNLGMNT